LLRSLRCFDIAWHDLQAEEHVGLSKGLRLLLTTVLLT
jgi:hypothetical protein